MIAASDQCIAVERNQYFPPDAANHEYLRASSTQTICPWKGTASYFDVVVNGETNKDAAWYYSRIKIGCRQYQGLHRVLEGRYGRVSFSGAVPARR